MGKSAEKSAWEKDRERLLAVELRSIMHQEPSEVHLRRAAEAAGLTEEDRGLMPLFKTNAQLIAWIRSVKAASGNPDAFSDFADRFDPKPSRPSVAVVTPNAGGAAAPVASTNTEEQTAAENFYDQLVRGGS